MILEEQVKKTNTFVDSVNTTSVGKASHPTDNDSSNDSSVEEIQLELFNLNLMLEVAQT